MIRLLHPRDKSYPSRGISEPLIETLPLIRFFRERRLLDKNLLPPSSVVISSRVSRFHRGSVSECRKSGRFEFLAFYFAYFRACTRARKMKMRVALISVAFIDQAQASRVRVRPRVFRHLTDAFTIAHIGARVIIASSKWLVAHKCASFSPI